MAEQRVTLLGDGGRANQAGRYVDLSDRAEIEFPVEASTVVGFRVGDWVVSPQGEVTDPPLDLVLGAQPFAAPGTYRLSLKRTTS